MIIPPHSLRLTAVEDDNRDLDMVARNNGNKKVTFKFEVKGPDGVKARVKSPFSDANEFQNECTFEATVEPNRQKPLTFGLVYNGDEMREDTVVAQISDGKSTVRRVFDVILFEN